MYGWGFDLGLASTLGALCLVLASNMEPEARFRAGLEAAGVDHSQLSQAAYRSEVDAGRAGLATLIGTAPAGAPPYEDQVQELVHGSTSFVRRLAAAIPQPRNREQLEAVLPVLLNSLLHRTRIRARYQESERAAHTMTALANEAAKEAKVSTASPLSLQWWVEKAAERA